MEFEIYKRKGHIEARPASLSEIETKELDPYISISQADIDNGSPKKGDMIARNPDNYNDQWLIAEDYFRNNYVI